MRNLMTWWLGGEEPKLKSDEIKIWFTPKEDITAYELARIVERVALHNARHTGITATKDQWRSLPPQLSRHFTLEGVK